MKGFKNVEMQNKAVRNTLHAAQVHQHNYDRSKKLHDEITSQ